MDSKLTPRKRKDAACLGKLRTNVEQDRYVLFDQGENPKKYPKVPLEEIRSELLAVSYVLFYRVMPLEIRALLDWEVEESEGSDSEDK